jgi:hypothetical protein
MHVPHPGVPEFDLEPRLGPLMAGLDRDLVGEIEAPFVPLSNESGPVARGAYQHVRSSDFHLEPDQHRGDVGSNNDNSYVALVDLDQIAVAQRRQITIEYSRDFAFNADQTAVRTTAATT